MRYPSAVSSPGRQRSYQPGGPLSSGYSTEGAALTTSQVRLSSMRSLASMRFPLRTGLQSMRARTENGATASPQEASSALPSALPNVSIAAVPDTSGGSGSGSRAAGSPRLAMMPPPLAIRLDSASARRGGSGSPQQQQQQHYQGQPAQHPGQQLTVGMRL